MSHEQQILSRAIELLKKAFEEKTHFDIKGSFEPGELHLFSEKDDILITQQDPENPNSIANFIAN